jgi:hypothetical protein
LFDRSPVLAYAHLISFKAWRQAATSSSVPWSFAKSMAA